MTEGRASPERPEGRASERATVSSADPPELTIEQAKLLPFYHDLRNEIVQPDKIVVATQYFWTRWAPRLGPTLTALIVCLRRHCYYNRITQERRDWCFPEQATLAREIGVDTTKTIRAALSHPLAAYFVRREARYVYDPQRGKKVRTSDRYYVAMDDPLTPEDEALLAVRAAERLAREGRLTEMILPEPGAMGPRAKDTTSLADASRTPEPTVTPIDRPRSARARKDRSPKDQKDLQVKERAPLSNGDIDRQVPDGKSLPQDSAVLFAPEEVLEESTDTTKYGAAGLFRAFEAANGQSLTPAQRARLLALVAEFDPIARRASPPSTGLAWVYRAIAEAVESGSHYVAPRRIARICERWAAEGMAPNQADASESGADVSLPASSTSPSPTVADRADEFRSAAGERDEGWSDGSPGVDRYEELTESFVVFPDLEILSRPLWRAIRDEARALLNSPGDRQLLEGTRLLRREGRTFVVGVPGQAAARRAEQRLARPLGRVIEGTLGRDVSLRFVSLAPGLNPSMGE